MSKAMDDLRAHYRAAHYRVDAPDARFVLRIGDHSPALAALLARHAVDGAAFLTACNPRSRICTDAENHAAQAVLRAALAGLGMPCLPGAGVDPRGAWPDEESLLVIGIGREQAIELARRFEQYALVYSDASGVPALVWAHPEF